MKILFLTNLYPPHFIGGYELGCSAVVEAFKERGHQVKVLTSTYGVRRPVVEGHIHRVLRIDRRRLPSKASIIRKELMNQKHFRTMVSAFRPDVIFCWNMAGISLSMVRQAEDENIPVCYYLFDNWIATWEMDHWYQYWLWSPPAVSRFLRFFCSMTGLVPHPAVLDLSHAFFASRYLRDVAAMTGKPAENSPVIPWGIPVEQFARPRADNPPRRLLYVGQIVPLKGVHTAVRALALLKDEGTLTLTIAGDADFQPAYTEHLKKLAEDCGISDRVRFAGKVAPPDIPELYANHDIMIFPSEWDEPFGITQLEAMAAGLVVVGTATGGSAEILEHTVNALTFEKGNPESCAYQVRRLLADEALFRSLRDQALRAVERTFSQERLITELEGRLTGVQYRPVDISTGPRPDVPGYERKNSTNNIRSTAVFFQKLLSTAVLVVFHVLRKIKLRIQDASDRSRPAVLIVQLGEEEDALLSIPFLDQLHRSERFRSIVVAAQPVTEYIFAGLPFLARTLSFELKSVRGWRQFSRGHIQWWTQALGLRYRYFRREKVDIAVSLRWLNDHCQAASAAIMNVSGARTLIGFHEAQTDMFAQLLDHFVTEGPVRTCPASEVERQRMMLNHLGITDEQPRTVYSRINHRAERKDAAGQSIRKEPVIAISPGGSTSVMCWPLERFIEVTIWLQTTLHASIDVVGHAKERPACTGLYESLHEKGELIIGNYILPQELPSLNQRYDLFLGNENVHLYAFASAGVPCVGLFGPGDSTRLDSRSVENRIVRVDIACSPCYDSCMFQRTYCMHGITTDSVKKALLAIMDRVSSVRNDGDGVNCLE
jgi:glycosyltransferase involved in cell wall biosynthesis/ADP-heptose:LPS heptosyltransferase